MATPMFKVGDVVVFRSVMGTHVGGAFEIIRLQPADTPEPAYRLKGIGQPVERIAKEHEIRLAPRVEPPIVQETRDGARRK